jgi:hypothetical protein
MWSPIVLEAVKVIFIIPTLRVGMLKRTLQRPPFSLCFIDVFRFDNEDAGASTAAFQRRALER